MRKYVLLTSVLALAACGGGGGGHSSSGVPERAAVSQASLNSNSAITSMASEILVANGAEAVVNRSGKVVKDGITYTSYRLDDIKLFAADASHTDNGYLQLGMDDNGRIDRVTMVVGGTGGDIARVNESEQFNGPIFEYVMDEVHAVADQTQVADAAARDAYRHNQHWDDDGKWVQNNGKWEYIEYGNNAVVRVADTGQTKAQLDAKYKLTGGHWNRVDELMNVETYGDDIGGGQSLQYADFGHFNPVYKQKQLEMKADGSYEKVKTRTQQEIDDELAEQDYQLFAGGYAINGMKLQDTLDAPKETSFKGKALGRVYASISGGGEGRNDKLAAWDVPFDNETHDAYTENAGHDMTKLYTTTEATMTIDASGKQTLYMPFNSHSDTSDTFYDVTIVKNTNGTISNPVFDGTPSGLQYRKNDAGADVEKEFNPKYYGVNVPSEAAGTAMYYDKQNLGDGFKREWEFQAAYGMKRQ